MRLQAQRYLELLREEGDRIAATAPRGLDRAVPPCPGWDVAEAVRHTATVYHHKIACMRLGREPEDGEWLEVPAPDEDLVAWFRAAHRSILDELGRRDPADPAYTWWPPDQTVGFWYRRMALETVVHRADVESAFGDLTPVGGDLAVDGIDEVLSIMLAGEDEAALADRSTGTVAVRTAGGSWTVHLEASRSAVEPGARNPADAELSGDPSVLFLHLWGRATADSLSRTGDITLISGLRTRLASATQ